MGLCDDLRLVEVNQKRTENKFRTKSTKKKKQRTKFPELSAAHAFTRAHCAQCARNEPVRTMRTGNNLDAHEMVDMLLARARAPILYKYSSVLTIVCVGPWGCLLHVLERISHNIQYCSYTTTILLYHYLCCTS
jgi:hypothetical protein